MKNGGGNKQAYGRPQLVTIWAGVTGGGPLEISRSKKTESYSESPVGLILLSRPDLPVFF